MSFLSEKPLAIFYEHPPEYNAIFRALHQRGINARVISPASFYYDPEHKEVPYSLIINDLSTPIGFQRRSASIRPWLTFNNHLELNQLRLAQGRMINNAAAIENMTNRARQLSVFSALDLPYPKTRAVSNADHLMNLIPGFGFPLLVKPGDTWSNKPSFRFDTLDELLQALIQNVISFDDGLWLLQEYVQPAGNYIVRVETLNGGFLSARKIYTTREPLPLWPIAYPAERFTPPLEIIQAVESIVRLARIDIGAVEYFTDQKTNQVLFYSIRPHTGNALSEEVSAVADYLSLRLKKIREMELHL
jgi:hypothetical protein